jgi:hypothetical protein
MAKKKVVDESPASVPALEPVADPYPYELPRWLHKWQAEPLRVDTPTACDEALADGWALRPPQTETPA